MKSDPSRSFKFLGFLSKYGTTRVLTRLTDFNKLSIFMLLFEFFPSPDFDCRTQKCQGGHSCVNRHITSVAHLHVGGTGAWINESKGPMMKVP